MAARFACAHAEQVAKAVASGGAARSALIASWRRSADLHRLDPDAAAAPRRIGEGELAGRASGAPLVRGGAALDRLFLAVGGVGCCVLLADRDGVPVDRRGAPADDETFDAWGLWTGAVWSEDAEGTNGIGTCLVEQRPLTIHRDQHFFTRNTCSLHHRADLRRTRTARRRARRLLLPRRSHRGFRPPDRRRGRRRGAPDRGGEFPPCFPRRASCWRRRPTARPGLVAVDADDLVVGATRAARLGLGLTCVSPPACPPRPSGEEPSDGEDFVSAERAVLQRALARSDGNVSAAAGLGVPRARCTAS